MSERRLTPIKAIREKCIDCCAGQKEEVRQCIFTDCSLYPYRLGKNPNIKPRVLTEEQRNASRERIRKAMGYDK